MRGETHTGNKSSEELHLNDGGTRTPDQRAIADVDAADLPRRSRSRERAGESSGGAHAAESDAAQAPEGGGDHRADVYRHGVGQGAGQHRPAGSEVLVILG